MSNNDGETSNGLHFTSSSCSSKEADNLYSFILDHKLSKRFVILGFWGRGSKAGNVRSSKSLGEAKDASPICHFMYRYPSRICTVQQCTQNTSTSTPLHVFPRRVTYIAPAHTSTYILTEFIPCAAAEYLSLYACAILVCPNIRKYLPSWTMYTRG